MPAYILLLYIKALYREGYNFLKFGVSALDEIFLCFYTQSVVDGNIDESLLYRSKCV